MVYSISVREFLRCFFIGFLTWLYTASKRAITHTRACTTNEYHWKMIRYRFCKLFSLVIFWRWIWKLKFLSIVILKNANKNLPIKYWWWGWEGMEVCDFVKISFSITSIEKNLHISIKANIWRSITRFNLFALIVICCISLCMSQMQCIECNSIDSTDIPLIRC